MTVSTLTPLLSAKEVGLIIGRHEKTVLQLAAKNKLRAVRQNAGSVQFTEEAVRDYIASCEVPAETLAAKESEPKPTRNPKYGESAPPTAHTSAKRK